MVIDDLFLDVKARGFDSLESFVRAYVHYVSEEKRVLFVSLFGEKDYVSEKYVGGGVYGKG